MMTRKITYTAAFLITTLVAVAQDTTLDLAGNWTYQLDSLDSGEKEGWTKRLFQNNLRLPGTLDDHGIGAANDLSPKFEKATLLQLTRKHQYTGATWYSREVVIPENWKGKTILLGLERVLWETQVWIDGKRAGMQESIVAPHEFEVTNLLPPGNHTITLRIDNREKYDVSHTTRNLAHAYTDGTQIVWNGVIGDLRLHAKDPLYINDVQLYPDVDSGTITAIATLKNPAATKRSGELTLTIENHAPVKVPFTFSGTQQTVTAKYSLAKPIIVWDEFNPHLYTLTVEMNAGQGKKRNHDSKSLSFGMRKLAREGNKLYLNNKQIFLRGTLECAIFPLTGYPPTGKAAWKKIYETAKAYGLNHLRFHSWCPPQAAFQAADEAGFYLQVELPFWNKNAGQDEGMNRFLKEEGYRMIRNYGNHPSFCFWSMGNELEGDFEWVKGLLSELKQADGRHLYTTTTFTFQKGKGLWPEPVDDFYVTQYTKKGWVRGQGVFDTSPPAFNKDFSATAVGIPVPLISHEIGQYSIYPRLSEIEKYTGVLAPLNFKAIQEDLKKKGMLASSDDFTNASGKFAVALYKEEIERALKTPEFSGFQLLDLHDFPGQGTALVGVLDAFWDSKGLITPEQFRQFCSAIVPLIRYEKAVYTSNESFSATVEVANFSNDKISRAVPVWTISVDGQTLASGKLDMRDIPLGNGTALGKIEFPLGTVTKASCLTIEVGLQGTDYKNAWKIWVYPSNIAVVQGDVVIARSLEEALGHLEAGRRVLLNPPLNTVSGIEGKFVPVFWSPVHFPNQPGSMGILCDPSHSALKHFPTQSHTDWQWWHLCKKSKPMVLDTLGTVLKPIVQVVDNFYKNRTMATVIEAKVGNGKLLLCSIDLLNDNKERPEAKQLLASLLHYMNSAAFSPTTPLNKADLLKLVTEENKKP